MAFDVHRRRYWVASVVAIVAVVAAVTALASARGSGPPTPSSRSAGGAHSTTTTTTATNSPRATVPASAGTTGKFTSDSIPKGGIYEFAGGNSGADAHNPDLAGTTLTFEWARLEPAARAVRLERSGPGHRSVGRGGETGHPAGEYGRRGGMGSRRGRCHARRGSMPRAHQPSMTTVRPCLSIWNPTYLADYDAFIAAYAARYDGDPAVSFIEMGIGDGGETLPDTQEGATDHLAQWAPYGYTDAVWLSTIEKHRHDLPRGLPANPRRPPRRLDLLRPDPIRRLPGAHRLVRDQRVPHAVRRAHLYHDAARLVVGRRPRPLWSNVDRPRAAGDTLAGDCADATGPMGSKVVLIYQSDIDDPANQEALNACAKSVGS